jgi:hypothetical protein
MLSQPHVVAEVILSAIEHINSERTSTDPRRIVPGALATIESYIPLLDSAHFAWEDAPNEYAALVIRCWSDPDLTP